MKKTIFLLSLLLVLLALTTQTLSQRCNKNDETTLFQIKKALGNPYHLTSWKKTEDCCTWYCVKCNKATGRIIELTIFSGNISGQIPPEVGNLPYLQMLEFHKLTNITGPIPSTISKLTNLNYLILSNNDLSGPIPSSLSALKNLNYLDLSFNKLSGSIPPQLATLPKLTELNLGRNMLTGVIPESFGMSKVLTSIHLSHNRLTGHVPKSLGGLNFSTVDFSRNQLTGDLSMLFGKSKTNIHSVYLSRNAFQFDLSKVVFPASLEWLDLSHNKIYGSLPATLTGLRLQNLDVSYNMLCGKIPQGGGLQKVQTTSYAHNKCLCGSPLPACSKMI